MNDVDDDQDLVFRALADPTRRLLLDRLFRRDGQTLSDLVATTELTRFGVMRHLEVLEAAGLVITRKDGRWKLHYLNAVPIRQIHDRWIAKYVEPGVVALLDLKHELENDHDNVDDRSDATDLHQGDPGDSVAGDHHPGVE